MLNQLRPLLFKRFNSSAIKWKLTDSIKQPKYDTGCTCCQPKLPQDKQINFDQPLNKSSAIPERHIMALTTDSNKMEQFDSKIENMPGTLAHKIHELKSRLVMKPGVSVSSIVLKNHNDVLKGFGVDSSGGTNEQLVFIYPDMKAIKFDLDHTDQFLKKYNLLETNQQEVYNPFLTSKQKEELQKKNNENDITVVDSNFEEVPIRKDLIVTCGHAKRDIRCGELGPLITNEFDQVLKSKGLADETYLGEITHIGGHAFAGNVLYYPKQSKSSRDFIWYGRVFPQMVQSLVDDTIVNKLIVKELFRGDLSKYE
ncbi:hypothetical protein KGF54_000088 [Candida jiufengensis]|uniref:uncharacterized protein n=1 Tax=Candida jiufengensis TaxID=497108 RepID=UPI00222538D2|nr:uncharacterized protein KGF54_000088 [Candida jiufengensis]KAI5957160.1 hypothetical protein KGF54_000088 [Candida jiufengensis]